MGACFSTFPGVPIEADEIGQSNFFFDLCAGHRCILTTCHRADKPLYDWYTSLSQGGSREKMTIAEQVRDANCFFQRGRRPAGI